MSQKIITLPKQLANQIAAGEVVERPVSVVKELLENALDAGATNIRISIENGGIDLIEIQDNGYGIVPGDLEKALEKYSTSKISSIEDLFEVMTFGFRGEALASISSVSEFVLSSKISGDTGGRYISTLGGDDTTKGDIAHEVGTTIQVKNLFFNTPARKSFLKKPRTEYTKIYELVQKMALCYPGVGWSFYNDSKSVLSLSEHQSLKERIYAIFGEDFSENILEISYEFSGIKISGYITDPKISFQNKSRQVLFVNKRIISSPMIFKAISEAYNRFIPHKSFPGYILHVDIDPTQVDVNVHPRKMEVRFAQENVIFRSVYHAIHDELERVSLYSTTEQISHSTPHPQSLSSREREETYSKSYYTGSGTKFKNYSPYKNTQANPAQAAIEFSREILDMGSEKQNLGTPGDVHDTPLGRIIGQVHNSYIVVQTGEGIQILDQHALAERVIYEKLASTSYTPKVQQILGGIGMHLTTREISLLEEHTKSFEAMGFEIDVLSEGNIMIQGIPDFIKAENIKKVLSQVLGDIGELGSQGLTEIQNKLWAYTACRSAVKFGDPLSIFEIRGLLLDANLAYSSTCPHGRPVVYDIGLQQLQKKYER